MTIVRNAEVKEVNENSDSVDSQTLFRFNSMEKNWWEYQRPLQEDLSRKAEDWIAANKESLKLAQELFPEAAQWEKWDSDEWKLPGMNMEWTSSKENLAYNTPFIRGTVDMWWKDLDIWWMDELNWNNSPDNSTAVEEVSDGIA